MESSTRYTQSVGSSWEAVALTPYRCREVRDLAWAFGAPPLFQPPTAFATWPDAAATAARIDGDWADWLSELDADPSRLIAHLAARRSPRLGHYFEALYAFGLAEGPHTRLLAESVPLREGRATVGELDFVYASGSDVIHLEVAVKFYLRILDVPAAGAYVGPGLRDRFDLKLDKLIEHQSRRLLLPATQLALRERGLVAHRAEVRLTGVLFGPLLAGSTAPMPGLSPAGLRGAWLPLSDTEHIDGSGEWHALERLQWLSGPPPDDPGVSFAALADIVRSRAARRPVQICRTRAGEIIERFFVVPDDFPARARAAVAPELRPTN